MPPCKGHPLVHDAGQTNDQKYILLQRHQSHPQFQIPAVTQPACIKVMPLTSFRNMGAQKKNPIRTMYKKNVDKQTYQTYLFGKIWSKKISFAEEASPLSLPLSLITEGKPSSSGQLRIALKTNRPPNKTIAPGTIKIAFHPQQAIRYGPPGQNNNRTYLVGNIRHTPFGSKFRGRIPAGN
jgi:hypothetical protein